MTRASPPFASRALALNILSLTLLMLAWWLATRATADGAMSVSPAAVWNRMRDIAASGYMGAGLWESLQVSAGRILVGWCAAGLAGVALGLVIGVSPAGRAILEPWLNYGRCLPPLGYLGLVVLWFGVGMTSKIVLLMLSGVPPVAVGTAAAVAAVRPERIAGARSMGFGQMGVLRHVVLPSALPGILVSLRIAFGAVFAALIGAEMVASSSGIAWMTITAVNRGDTPIVIGCILLMGVIALAADGVLQLAAKKLVPWAGRA